MKRIDNMKGRSRTIDCSRSVARRLPLSVNKRTIGVVVACGLTLLIAPATLSQKTKKPQRDQPAIATTAPSAADQQKPSIQIDATSPNQKNNPTPKVDLDKAENYQAVLNVGNSDGNWRVIRFTKLNRGVTLEFAANADAYPRTEKVLADTWYPFKRALPFDVTIEKQASLPLELPYEVTTVSQAGQLSLAALREFVNKAPENVDRVQVRGLVVTFENANPPPPPTPTPSPSASVDPEKPFIPLWLLIPSAGLLAVTVVTALVVLILKQMRKRRPSGGHHPGDERLDGVIEGRTSYTADGRGGVRHQGGSKREKRTQEVAESIGNFSGYQEEPRSSAAPLDVNKGLSYGPEDLYSPDNTSRTTETTHSLAAGDRHVPEQRDIQPLNDSPPIQPAQIDRNLLEKLTRIELTNKSLFDRMNDLSLQLAQDFDAKLNDLRNELKDQADNNAQAIADMTIEAMQSQVRQVTSTFEQRFADVKAKEKDQDDRYSKLFGKFLGESVQTLKTGEYEQIVSETQQKLNTFLSQQPTNMSALQDLERVARAIDQQLQATAETVRKIKPESAKVQQCAERAKNLAFDLTMTNLQLQNRQRAFKATLEFPIEKWPNGRREFLDALGQAVKQVMDRWEDPHSYWSKALELFVTSDILAMADFCDVEVTGQHGVNRELEEKLTCLFREAGLTSISPQPGAAFKPGEQELIQMVAGSPLDREKIKRVIKRGFYYKADGKERLIRKAGVEVYR